MKLSNRFANTAGAAALSLTILFSSFLTGTHASYAATPITVGGKAIVTNTDGDNINVRSGVGTGNDKVATAQEGDIVIVVAGPKKDSDGNTWYKVQAQGGTGWVSLDYLDGKGTATDTTTNTKSASNTTNSSASLSGFATVANTDGDPLKMRSASSKDGKVITTLAADTTVAIKQGPLTDTDGITWYQVSANGVTGWVMGQYLTQSATPSKPVAEQKPVVQSQPAVEAKAAVAETKPVVAKPVVVKPVTQAVVKPVATNSDQTSNTQTQASVAVQSSTTNSVSTSSLGSRVVSIAMNYVGYRYRYGGASPSGFDCTGFVYYVYNKAGYGISRDMGSQWNSGSHISRDNLAPGDILFWSNTYKRGLSHAGIYIGGGRFVNAENSSTGVAISSLNTSYWASRYSGAVRPSK